MKTPLFRDSTNPAYYYYSFYADPQTLRKLPGTAPSTPRLVFLSLRRSWTLPFSITEFKCFLSKMPSLRSEAWLVCEVQNQQGYVTR